MLRRKIITKTRGRYLILYLTGAMLLLTSCFKEDERVVPVLKDDIETVTIEMMEDYSRQVFFSITDNKIVNSINKDSWDIALSCDENDYTLLLNTAMFMKAAHTGKFNFDSVYTVSSSLHWQFDSSDGAPSGNAIGRWWDNAPGSELKTGEVLLIDKGIDTQGNPLGYVKMQPTLNILTQQVTLHVSAINHTEVRSYTFIKDPDKSYVTISFESGFNDPQPFPDNDQWELWFTQYTSAVLFVPTNQIHPYLVTGVLINPHRLAVRLDSLTPFNDVTKAYAESLELSSRLDIIGYDWKKVNGEVTSGDVTYSAKPEFVYIIKTADDLYYKLRFIDFYNNLGKKGYPKFEYQGLR